MYLGDHFKNTVNIASNYQHFIHNKLLIARALPKPTD